jgi:hypothetical protein
VAEIWSHTNAAVIEPQAPPSACGADGCRAYRVFECQYVDKRRRKCFTSWCAVHAHTVSGGCYCRRHASTLAALAGQESVGGIPDVDNRVPGLVRWVSREVQDRIKQMLWEMAPDQAVLVTDTVRMHVVKINLERRSKNRWATTWKLMDHASVLCSVAIEVDEDEPTRVAARVDGREVGHGIPPWIAHRTGVGPGNQDLLESRAFYDAIGNSIATGVRRAALAAAS